MAKKNSKQNKGKNKSSVLGNIAKSFGYSWVSAFKDMMPTTAQNIESNKNYIAEAYNSVNEKLDFNTIKQTYAYESLVELKNNAIKDLKSGKFYNKDREKKAQDQVFKDMGFDLDSFDNMLDDNNFDIENNDDSNTTNNNNNTNNIFVNNVDTNLGNEIQESNQSSASMILNSNATSTGILSKQLSNIYSFYQNQTTQFYSDMSSKIAEANTNLNKVATLADKINNIGEGGTQFSEVNDNDLDNLLNVSGLDFGGIGDMYKARHKRNSFLGSMLTESFDMLIKPQIEQLKANPLGFAMSKGIQALLPKQFKNSLLNLDRTIEHLPIMMQGTFQNWKQNGTGLKSTLGNLLSVDTRPDSKLNFSKYKKDAVLFDGITRKSIVTVIPELLGKILGAVSDNPLYKKELIYNYRTGMFTNKEAIHNQLDEDIRNFGTEDYNIKKYRTQIATDNYDKFDNKEDREAFIKDIEEAFNNMIKNGVIINSNTDLSRISKNKTAAQAIKENFNKQRNKGVYNSDMLNASSNYQRLFENINNDEGLQTAFNVEDSTKGYNKMRTRDELSEIEKLRQDEEKLVKLFGKNSMQHKIFKRMNYQNDDLNDDDAKPLKKDGIFSKIINTVNGISSKIEDFTEGNLTFKGSKETEKKAEEAIKRKAGFFGINLNNLGKVNRSKDNETNNYYDEKKDNKESKINYNKDKTEDESSFNKKSDINYNTTPNSFNNQQERIEKLEKLVSENEKGNSQNSSSIDSKMFDQLISKLDDLSILSSIDSNTARIIEILETRSFGSNEEGSADGNTKTHGIHGVFNKAKAFGKRILNRKGKFKPTDLLGTIFAKDGIISKVFGIGKKALTGTGKMINYLTPRLIGKNGMFTNLIKNALGGAFEIANFALPKFFHLGKRIVKASLKTLGGAVKVGGKGLFKILGFAKDKITNRKKKSKEDKKHPILSGLFKAGKGIKNKITSHFKNKKNDNNGSNATSTRKSQGIMGRLFSFITGKKDNQVIDVNIIGGTLDEVSTIKEVLKVGNESLDPLGDKIKEIEKEKNNKPIDVSTGSMIDDALTGDTKSLSKKIKRKFENKIGGKLGSLFGKGKGIVGGLASKGLTKAGSLLTKGKNSGILGKGKNLLGKGINKLGSKLGSSAVEEGAEKVAEGSAKKGLFKRGIGKVASFFTKDASKEGAEAVGKGVAKKVGEKAALKAGAKVAGKGLSRFIPGVGQALALGSATVGAISGAKDAGNIFGTNNVSVGQRISGGVGGALSALTLGIVNQNKMAKAVYKIGDVLGKLGKFFMKGPLGVLFGLLGKLGSKVKDFFKGLFGKIFGTDDNSASANGVSGTLGTGVGALSTKYESNGDPGTVSSGAGDHGGQSFGLYQFSRNMGSFQRFVNSLQKTHPDWYKQLSAVESSPAQSAAVWKQIAAKNSSAFSQAQEDYAKQVYLLPAANSIASALGLDVSKRSIALQAVLMSTAIQHGQGGALTVFRNALAGKDASKMSDADIIKAVYTERGANNGMKYFSSSSAAVRQGVVNRFKNEKADALSMLNKEGGGSSGSSGSSASSSDSGTYKSSELDYYNPLGGSGSSGGSDTAEFTGTPAGVDGTLGAFAPLVDGTGMSPLGNGSSDVSLASVSTNNTPYTSADESADVSSVSINNGDSSDSNSLADNMGSLNASTLGTSQDIGSVVSSAMNNLNSSVEQLNNIIDKLDSLGNKQDNSNQYLNNIYEALKNISSKMNNSVSDNDVVPSDQNTNNTMIGGTPTNNGTGNINNLINSDSDSLLVNGY